MNKKIKVDIKPQETIIIHVHTDPAVNINIIPEEKISVVVREAFKKYNGSYTFTASQVQQTISTAGKLLEQDITIEPIPSNYGRIEWNGSTLSVI